MRTVATYLLLILLASGSVLAQDCSSLFDTAYLNKAAYWTCAIPPERNTFRPTIFKQRNKTYSANPGIIPQSILVEKQFGRIYLLAREMNNDNLNHFIPARYHGKVKLWFDDGDSCIVETLPIYRSENSFGILLSGQRKVRFGKQLGDLFNMQQKQKLHGNTELFNKLKMQLITRLDYIQAVIKEDSGGYSLQYAMPVINHFTEPEARKLQQALICLTQK